MNLTQLMKQAQQMQKKAAKKQAELDAEIHEFEGANQLIKGTIKGNLEIISLGLEQDSISSLSLYIISLCCLKTSSYFKTYLRLSNALPSTRT